MRGSKEGFSELREACARRWRHVLLTRYTFVNTLQRVKPLLTDWTQPLPAPDGLDSLAAAGAPVPGDRFASGSAATAAAAKRDKFLARMSRRVMKNSRRR